MLNAEGQEWARLLGVPEALWNDIPAMPLPDELHMLSERVGELPNFHDIFRQEKLRIEAEDPNLNWNQSTAFRLHQEAYIKRAGPVDGARIGCSTA